MDLDHRRLDVVIVRVTDQLPLALRGFSPLGQLRQAEEANLAFLVDLDRGKAWSRHAKLRATRSR